MGRLTGKGSRFFRSRKASYLESNSSNEAVVSPPSTAAKPHSPPPSVISEKIVAYCEPAVTPRRTPEPVAYRAVPPPQPDYSTLMPTPPAPSTPYATQGQRCKICQTPYTRAITRSSNRNGNAGRPYDKCVPCDKFIRFVDDRGVDPGDQGNPLCDCGHSSRRQLTSPQKGRRIFYKCVAGNCDFFQWHKNDDGTDYAVGEDVADALKRLRVI